MNHCHIITITLQTFLKGIEDTVFKIWSSQIKSKFVRKPIRSNRTNPSVSQLLGGWHKLTSSTYRVTLQRTIPPLPLKPPIHEWVDTKRVEKYVVSLESLHYLTESVIFTWTAYGTE